MPRRRSCAPISRDAAPISPRVRATGRARTLGRCSRGSTWRARGVAPSAATRVAPQALRLPRIARPPALPVELAIRNEDIDSRRLGRAFRCSGSDTTGERCSGGRDAGGERGTRSTIRVHPRVMLMSKWRSTSPSRASAAGRSVGRMRSHTRTCALSAATSRSPKGIASLVTITARHRVHVARMGTVGGAFSCRHRDESRRGQSVDRASPRRRLRAHRRRAVVRGTSVVATIAALASCLRAPLAS